MCVTVPTLPPRLHFPELHLRCGQWRVQQLVQVGGEDALQAIQQDTYLWCMLTRPQGTVWEGAASGGRATSR